ncbi:MAG: lipoyl synthase [Deltaproteobacteria bacterium]|nr:lipoyl synthase [Deltaproteobacteria bacterium]
MKNNSREQKPHWLKTHHLAGAAHERARRLLAKGGLHTVCQEARCPNLWDCFSRDTAAFLILGNRCTRNCRFCAVPEGIPAPHDPEEPRRVAAAVRDLRLDYVVVTSVTRDDLQDGGASSFAATIHEVRTLRPGAGIEVLIPDFLGSQEALCTVIAAHPDVLNHNSETVSRLYETVRPEASYPRSLDVLRNAKTLSPTLVTKSGIMLGLGEEPHEVHRTLHDLLDAGCDILTIGQYLQPTPDALPVSRYVTPEEFDDWGQTARRMGFAAVAAGPHVRSSFRARELHRLAVRLRSSSSPVPSHPHVYSPRGG